MGIHGCDNRALGGPIRVDQMVHLVGPSGKMALGHGFAAENEGLEVWHAGGLQGAGE